MTQSMFERYGGFKTVRTIVSAFYDRMLESEIAAPYFADTDMRRLLDHQSKFVASLMGGPASYSNDELLRIHRRLGIDEAAFREAAMLLEETLEDLDIDADDIAKILDLFTARKPYIVVDSAA
jgi:hemoglobin